MLVGILIFAFVIRLISLNQSLWLDEAIQAWASSSFSLKDLLTQFMPTDVHPPLAYLVNHYWGQLAGYSEIALRTPSVIFAVLTIYFTYKIGELIIPKQKHLAALLLATSGLHIYYSQEARMYSLAALAITISMWALLRFLKSQLNLVIYVFSTLAAVYTHYFTWLILPAQLLITWLLKPRQLKKLLLTQIVIILTYLPWIPVLKYQLLGGIQAAASNQQWASVVGSTSLKALALIPIKFLIGRISIDNNYIFTLTLLLPLTLVAYLCLSAFKSTKKNPFAIRFLSAWLLIPILLASFISLKLPVLGYYRLLFTLPAFYLLISLGVNQAPKRRQSLIISCLILINLVSSATYLFNSRFHRENWRQLAQVLVEKNIHQSPVVIISVVQAPLKYYYAGNEIYHYSQTAQLNDQTELWLIPYAEPLFDPSQQTQQQLISAGFTQNFKQHFRPNLTLIQYIK